MQCGRVSIGSGYFRKGFGLQSMAMICVYSQCVMFRVEWDMRSKLRSIKWCSIFEHKPAVRVKYLLLIRPCDTCEWWKRHPGITGKWYCLYILRRIEKERFTRNGTSTCYACWNKRNLKVVGNREWVIMNFNNIYVLVKMMSKLPKANCQKSGMR